MRLIRFGNPGEEKPGIITNDEEWLDVSHFVADYNLDFFEQDGISNLKSWLSENESTCPLVSNQTRLGPPVARPSKLVCVGLNYEGHGKGISFTPPAEPVIFFKATSAICGPYDNMVLPKNSTKSDWEVELAFVIGKEASYVELDKAMDHIAGYMIHNDYSEREHQMERGGQWVKGKSADTFAPLGPFMATKDEIPKPSDLNLWLKVNGEQMQSSNTSKMIFDIPLILSYLSQFMTFLPGDVISTGTPPGVGMDLNPKRYLKKGDIVSLGIEGLGESKQTIVSFKPK